MAEHVTILGLSRVKKPKPNRGGSIILAYFDCVARGIELRGCALVRTKGRGLVVWAPNLMTDDKRRSIEIVDNSLRHGMMMHARQAYRALGGTEADQIGTIIPLDPAAIV